MGFKQFLTDSEEKEVEKTLAKLPKRHRDFVSRYTISFQGGLTLKGDNQHVGEVDDQTKKVIVAAPWRYSREHTLLHELAHLIVAKFLTPDKKKEWAKICKHTPMEKGDRQPDEELLCHAYAATYSKRPHITFYKPEWVRFVKSL